MSKATLLGASAVLLSATCICDAHAKDFVRPYGIEFMMPKAVDFVAEMVTLDGNRKEHVIVTRANDRQREDTTASGRTTQTYSDLGNGFSWRTSHARDGAPLISVYGRSAGHTVAFKKTTEKDHLIGETCTVWASTMGVFTKECRTSDGIILWRKVFYRSGEEMRSTTAVSVQRRQVNVTEVTIPANALLLANYGDWTKVNSDLPNDEVVLEGGGLKYQPPANVIIRRHLGIFSMEDTRTTDNRVRRYSNGTYAIDVYQTKSGDLDSLVVRKPFPQAGAEARPRPQKSKTQTIAGETCRTVDTSVPDAPSGSCVSKDGLVLSTHSGSFGKYLGGGATQISRGKMTLDAVAPPADLLRDGWSGPGALPDIPVSPIKNVTPTVGIGVAPTASDPEQELEWLSFPPTVFRTRISQPGSSHSAIEGVVVLDCELGLAGILRACEIVTETPKGYGFGAATIGLFRSSAVARAHTYTPGQKVKLAYRWLIK